jgi:hypothetical protein
MVLESDGHGARGGGQGAAVPRGVHRCFRPSQWGKHEGLLIWSWLIAKKFIIKAVFQVLIPRVGPGSELRIPSYIRPSYQMPVLAARPER